VAKSHISEKGELVYDVESHVTQKDLSMFNEHSEHRWLCGYPVVAATNMPGLLLCIHYSWVINKMGRSPMA
jgi:hypothetical protein